LPISVPLKNQPIAVARSVGLYISPIHDAPTIRKDVPSRAVRMRKTKKAARFGLRAVPSEQAKKRTELQMQICIVEDIYQQPFTNYWI
jgi:hypothetical protein